MLHIFFPSLSSDDRKSPLLSKEEAKALYEKGLRPSIEQLLPQSASDWPATYQTELFRASKAKGGFAYQTKMVPQWAVPRLASLIRQNLQDNGVNWAEDFFFMSTIRGSKHSTTHSLTSDAAKYALDDFMGEAFLDIPHPLSAESDQWWIDVGVEFSSEEEACFQWLTSSHGLMVQETLKISEQHANRITTLRSSKYFRDISSHLPTVSGCRIEPGVNAEGPFQAAYFQIYTTDKAVTYNPQGGRHGKTMSINAAMGNSQPPAFVSGLFDVFLEAVESNYSSARIEIRVPILHANTAMLGFDNEIVNRSILSFQGWEWWQVFSIKPSFSNTDEVEDRNFRLFRLLAISNVFELQQCGNRAFRVTDNALGLTAGCVWLVNALHARPEDGPSNRELMRTVLPLAAVEDINDIAMAYAPGYASEGQLNDASSDIEMEELLIPYHPYGAIFFRRLQLKGDVPRLRQGGPVLSERAFRHLFKKTRDEILHTYFRASIIPWGRTKRTKEGRPLFMFTPMTSRSPVYSISLPLATNFHHLPSTMDLIWKISKK
jgi:hypothetical protein